jgi:transcriptional regulator with XRE-family HTH domain
VQTLPYDLNFPLVCSLTLRDNFPIIQYGEKKMRSFNHVGQLIRTKRTMHPKNYSQAELSHLLGYKNGQFISNVERSLCHIPLKMLHRVANLLDISFEEFKEAILKDEALTIENHFFQSETTFREKKEIDLAKDFEGEFKKDRDYLS